MIRVGDPGDSPALSAPRAAGLRARVLAGSGHALGARAGLAEIEVAPGRSLPARAHPDGDALVYVVAGRGRFLGEQGAGEVGGGGVVHLSGGARVAITNVGAGTLRLLAVYSPAGPERGFLDWGEAVDDRAAVAVRLDEGAEVIPLAGAALRRARGSGHAPSAA